VLVVWAVVVIENESSSNGIKGNGINSLRECLENGISSNWRVVLENS
jgi:hypothetical protein